MQETIATATDAIVNVDSARYHESDRPMTPEMPAIRAPTAHPLDSQPPQKGMGRISTHPRPSIRSAESWSRRVVRFTGRLGAMCMPFPAGWLAVGMDGQTTHPRKRGMSSNGVGSSHRMAAVEGPSQGPYGYSSHSVGVVVAPPLEPSSTTLYE